MTIDLERWRRQKAVLDRVLEAPADAREEILDEACAGDLALRAEVEALLIADAAAGEFLAMPVGRFAADLLAEASGESPDAGQRIGEVVGPYRLVRLIGRGGMADVFLAERIDGQFTQQVALKLVRRELASALLAQRFLRERQILARLQHDHIARLLDGGMSERGEPYFAMEYVDGVPITEVCANAPLTERLGLFLDVCGAVQHAHRNLVVHLDLKPSNILVTPDRHVKLLDFGIARLLDPRDAHQTAGTLTRVGWRALTPHYAAPEQVVGGAVTTATDVYALAIILFELLTGRRVVEGEPATPVEIERAVCATEVAAPSSVVRGPLARRLRGDIDTIVTVGAAKAPDRRYASVEALSSDLRRHLDGLPIAARADSAAYRALKFARRHRFGLSAAALVITAILVGAAVAIREARLAQQQSVRATEVKDFLVGVFQQADPDSARRRDVTARELLDRSARALDTRLQTQSDVRTELLTLVGSIYQKLGAFDSSRQTLERAVASARAGGPTQAEALIEALSDLGSTQKELREFDDAERTLQEALSARRRIFAPDSPEIAKSLTDLGAVADERGRYDDAERLYREALTIDIKAFGERGLETATDHDNLGVMLWHRGRYDEADAEYAKSLAVRRSRLDVTDPVLLTTLGNLAVLRNAQARFEDAIALHNEVLEARRRIYGNDHPDVALSLANIATTYYNWRHLDESQRFQEQALDIRRRIFGPEHSETLISENSLATIAYFRGDYETAAKAFEDIFDHWRRQLGEQAPNTLTAENNLGAALTELGRYSEAERVLRAVLRGRQQALGTDHPDIAQTLRNLAVLLRRTGRLADAEVSARDALKIYTARLAPDHPRRAEAQVALGSVLLAEGRAREAEPLLREALSTRTSKLGPNHADTWYASGLLGAALAPVERETGLKRLTEAYAQLKDAEGQRAHSAELAGYLHRRR